MTSPPYSAPPTQISLPRTAPHNEIHQIVLPYFERSIHQIHQIDVIEAESKADIEKEWVGLLIVTLGLDDNGGLNL